MVVDFRKMAEGQSCIRCGADDGTIVLCHYSGVWQHKFGKGMRIKGSDLAAAELCAKCHRYFDEYHSGRSEYALAVRSEDFLAMCLLTIIRRSKRLER